MVRGVPPVRTCVGCRSRAPSGELLRVVADEHIVVERDSGSSSREAPGAAVVRIVPDPARTRPGRGAHIHPNLACLALAQRRRAFGRALRVTGAVDIAALTGYLDQQAQRAR